MSPTKLRIATRSSPLAIWQAEHVVQRLQLVHPDLEAVFVTTKTFGDRRQDLSIPELGGKGVFCKEIQQLVLDGDADVAVHSAKDLQAITPDGLVLAAICERGDARDALIGGSLADLPKGATVASGSNRRQALLRDERPDLRLVGLRGNIETRLAKLDHPDGPDAVVLAATALDRLGLVLPSVQRLAPDRFVPQVGQGALAVEVPAGDRDLIELVAAVDHEDTSLAVRAERSFLAELGGDCQLPAGAHAEVIRAGDGNDARSNGSNGTTPASNLGLGIRIRGVLADPEGTTLQRAEEVGPPSDDPGRSLARTLRKLVEATAPARG